MNVDTTNESVCIDELITKKQEIRQIEGDVIVPDIKPDILSIIRTSSNICVYKKEILDGKVRIDGTIQVYIIYMADDSLGSIRALNTNLDFSETIQLPEVNSQMNIEVKSKAKNIETKLINGRKVNISCDAEFEISIYCNQNIDIIKAINGIEDIQTSKHDTVIYSLVGRETSNAFAKETIKTDPVDNLAEILDAEISLSNIDTKISYNKILVKADVKTRVLYLTEDGKINTCEEIIPATCFVDMQGVSEEHFCKVDMSLKNIIVKPNNKEEHSMYIEIEYEALCQVYEKKSINIIEDLYSPTKILNINKRIAILHGDEKNVRDTYSLKEKINDSELVQGNICYAVITPDVISQTKENNKVNYECEIKIDILYYENGQSSIRSKKVLLSFQDSLDIPFESDNCIWNTQLYIRNQEIVIMPDGNLNVIVDIDILADFLKIEAIPIIDEITENENETKNICSLSIYFVQRGDTLWKIAKEFGSTIDEIMSVNEVEDANNIPIGKELFIPKHFTRKTA